MCHHLLLMKKPQALSAASQLEDDINDFTQGLTRVGGFDKRVFDMYMQAAEKLQRDDVVVGCLLRASLFSAAGMDAEALRMLRNVEANHARPQALLGRLTHYVNHGYASAALEVATELFADRGPYNFATVAEVTTAAGGFCLISQELAKSHDQKLTLAMTRVGEVAQRAAAVLEQLGVTDAQLASMLDLAGEALRAQQLWWQGNYTDIQVLPAQLGGPALMFDYRVFLTPTEAAQLSWDLGGALVDHELDLHGVHIGFIGTDLPVRLAA